VHSAGSSHSEGDRDGGVAWIQRAVSGSAGEGQNEPFRPGVCKRTGVHEERGLGQRRRVLQGGT
jgi:hypothetical protein